MMVRNVFAVVVLLYTVTAYKDYQGYRVLQVIPQDENQLAALHKMNNVLGFEVDFWRQTGHVGRAVDFMVAPDKIDKVKAFLADYKVVPKTVVANVATLVERSMKEIQETPTAFAGDDPSQFALDVYHTHAEINTWLQAVQTTYSSFVSIASMGRTLEGRDMLYLKIGTPSAQRKPALFIDAGIHAREWVAPATALYTIWQLVSGYSTTHKPLLDAIDIYVAPQVNPDGYEYSRLHDRMWRKTRSGPVQGCYGVDPNRNWSFHWGEAGTSTSPCSEIYAGTGPMTERNCINLKALLDANAAQIKGYLTLHSYGEDMIYPWGYATQTYPPDVNELRALGLQAAAAIRAVHGTRYVVDNSADSLCKQQPGSINRLGVPDPAAGASDDYGKSIGIKWVYTIELRPGDGDTDNDQSYGFDLPAQFIIPTAEETFPGIMVVANRIMTGPN